METTQATGLPKWPRVMTEEEIRAGFVRPLLDSYTHLTCQDVMRLEPEQAERYAREPEFYGGAWCDHCATYLRVGPDGEFVWVGTQVKVGT